MTSLVEVPPGETGENVYPDVVERAVMGVPDERWDETGRAVVVPREGTGTIRSRDVTIGRLHTMRIR